MHRTNLFDILQTFSKKELKRFQEYAASPYFNKNENVVKLLDLISEEFPNLNSEKLKKEAAFPEIFGKIKYDDAKMRVLIFNLANLAEDFIWREHLDSIETEKYKHKLEVLKNRALGKLFEKNLKEALELTDSMPRDEEYYETNYRFEYHNLAHQIRNYSDTNEKTLSKTNVQDIIDHLTYTYLIKLLKFYIFLFNVKNRYNIEYEMRLINELRTHLEKTNYEKVPLIIIYYHILMTHIDYDETKHFHKAKELLAKHEKVIDRINILNIYINLENYAMKRHKNNDPKYLNELLSLYKKEIVNKIYPLPDGSMSPIFFKNVVTYSLQNKEFEFTEKFIEKHKTEIKENLRESVYHLCLGMLHFKKKNYGSALEFLSKAQNENLMLKMDIKNLTLQIYYESQAFDSLSLLIDSYRHFLNNNKLLADNRRIPAGNALRFVNTLMKQYYIKDEFTLQKLEKQIIETRQVDYREWLIEKVRELRS